MRRLPGLAGRIGWRLVQRTSAQRFGGRHDAVSTTGVARDLLPGVLRL